MRHSPFVLLQSLRNLQSLVTTEEVAAKANTASAALLDVAAACKPRSWIFYDVIVSGGNAG